MAAAFGDIHIVREAHIAHVTIRKPPHNPMSIDMARDLADALEALDAEPDMRAVVLSSEGKSFCAGADLSGRASDVGLDQPTSNPLYDQAVRLHATQLPIVAAIQGPAIGAGLGLALIADVRIAAPDARFAANFTKLGFHPGFGLTYTLPRLIGRQRAGLMFLTSRRIKAEEAVLWGLVDELVYADLLMARAKAVALEIAENAPLAVRATRKTMRAELAAAVREATNHEFIEQQWLMKTDDFREGVKAVAGRRPGQFKGR